MIVRDTEFYVDWDNPANPVIRPMSPEADAFAKPKNFRECKDEITEFAWREVERGKEIVGYGKRLLAETRALRKVDIT